MNPAQKAAVAIFAVVIMSFYLANVEASPRIRSMRVSNIKYYESWNIFQEINLLGPVALLLQSVFEVVTAS